MVGVGREAGYLDVVGVVELEGVSARHRLQLHVLDRVVSGVPDLGLCHKQVRREQRPELPGLVAHELDRVGVAGLDHAHVRGFVCVGADGGQGDQRVPYCRGGRVPRDRSRGLGAELERECAAPRVADRDPLPLVGRGRQADGRERLVGQFAGGFQHGAGALRALFSELGLAEELEEELG